MRARGAIALLAVAGTLLSAAPATAAGPNTTLLLSRPSGLGALPVGAGGPVLLADEAVSGDGRYVVFASSADDLGVRDTRSHIWVRDTLLGSTSLVDRAPGGAPGDGFLLGGPSISRDGSTVCFVSSSNLVAGVTGFHVFVVTLASGATVVADRADTAGGVPSNDTNGPCVLDADGSHVAFAAHGRNLVAGDTNQMSDVFVRDLVTNTTERVSVASNGAQAPFGGGQPAISADGLKVAFTSISSLLAGETAFVEDVYVRNTQTDVLTRVSVATGSIEANGRSGNPSISDAGDVVAFDSRATNLAFADTNEKQDVFVRLIGADETVAVSRATPSGALGDADSGNPAISGNGVAVAFESAATNLGVDSPPGQLLYLRRLGTNETLLLSRASGAAGAPADAFSFGISLPTVATAAIWRSNGANLDPAAPGEFTQVFKRELSGEFPTRLVSRPTGTGPRPSGINGSFIGPRAVSADGRVVAFTSAADGLDLAGASRIQQLFARDTLTNATTLVTRAAGGAGAAANDFSQRPVVSADGRRVGFGSRATNLLPGGNEPGVFVRDLSSGELLLASRHDGPGGAPVSFGQDFPPVPALSADGTRVAFQSDQPIVPADTNGFVDVYVRDLAAGTTTLASVGQSGALGNGNSSQPAISADGTRVAFTSSAGNLLDGGPTPGTHVYVRDLAASTTTLVDRHSADGAPGTGSSFSPEISADGTRVLLTAQTALVPGAITGSALYVRDLTSATTTLASRADGASGAAISVSERGAMSGDGRHVSFDASGPNLPGAPTPDRPQVYVRDLAAQTTRLVSAVDGTADTLPNAFSLSGSALSSDGGCVAFGSNADNLTTPSYATRDFAQIYLRVMAGECPRPAPGPPAGPPVITPVAGNPPPVISDASMSRTRFGVGAGLTALSAKAVRRAPRGTSFRYTLSENATLRIAIARRLGGRRSGARCVRPTRALRRRRACTRLVARVTLRRAVKTGRGSTAFSGRWSRRQKLAAGAHQATLVATDAAGNRSVARTLRFTVVR